MKIKFVILNNNIYYTSPKYKTQEMYNFLVNRIQNKKDCDHLNCYF